MISPTSGSTSVPRPFRGLEAARIGLLAAAALLLFSPYLTANQLGGVDARWYATMLTDFLHQLRTGHFPVLAGRGAYDWSGGVHPFRSAPLFMTVAGAWDCLTLGTQNAYRLEHLTVLTSAVIGVVGFYLAAGAFLPGRRWTAFVLALFYLTCPIWLGLISGVEAYMSYLTFAVAPLVLYGNVRALRARDLGGFTALAVGLAISWAAHPPIAALWTLVSFGVQLMSVTAADSFPYATALRGMIWFPILALFYFAAESEVPTINDPNPLADVTIILGVGLAFVGLGRGILQRRGWGWLAVAAAGIGGVALYSPVLAAWCGVTAGLVALAALLGRAKDWRTGAGGTDTVLFSFLLAAGLVEAVRRMQGVPVSSFASLAFSRTAPELPRLLQPFVNDNGLRFGSGVLLCLLIGFGARWWRRDLALRALTAALLCLLLVSFRVPYIGDFLVGQFPGYVGGIINLGLLLRLLPVIVCLGLFSFVLVAAGPGPRRPALRWSGVGLAAALLALAIAQAVVFHRYDLSVVATPEATANTLLTENLPSFRFDYDLTLMPAYFTDGVDDPRLQLRLLNRKGEIVCDSRQAAAVSEAHHPLGSYQLVAPDRSESFHQSLTVQPGQRLVLRFEFDARESYSGWLFFYAKHGYREYHLPVSGLAASFGSVPENPHILTLWNSTSEPEVYALAYRALGGNTIPAGRPFARLIVSEWDQGIEPVSLEALTPMQVTFTAAEPDFLESCRVFLPGYVATVDGRPAAVSKSALRLVQVAVPAGRHTLVLELKSTAREWVGGVISLGGWLVLGLGLLRRRPRPVA